MLHKCNGKNLRETIVVSQDFPKFLGSPVTCSSQTVNTPHPPHPHSLNDQNPLSVKKGFC